MADIIPHWLTKQADLAPEKIAVEVDGNKSLTFSELHRESKLMAQKIATLNLKAGDRVAILSTNSLEMLITIHALTYLDMIIVLLNTRLTSKELNYQLANSETQLLITTRDMVADKQLVVPQTKTFHRLEQLPVQTDHATNDYIDLNKLATIMYTSGTTGLPKAVGHTYSNHWWSAISSGLNLGIHADDKWLSPLPMFHVGGLSVFIKSVIYGMSVYLLPHYAKERLSQIISKNKITIASLVTVMLADFIDFLGDEKSPKQLRAILLGGGSVPSGLLNKVKEKEIPLFQSYGMTETSSQIATLSSVDKLRKIGSAGKPLMPAEVKIAADENEVGEILVRGPMVINQYFNNQKATQEAFDSDWLKTGDLGYLDEEGFLYIVDRRSDLIISGGENIYPTEIEHLLLSHPDVKEVAVVKKDDEKYGQIPAAFIVLKANQRNPNFNLYLQDKLAKYKQPKAYYYLQALPRTASNKIKRFELEEYLKTVE